MDPIGLVLLALGIMQGRGAGGAWSCHQAAGWDSPVASDDASGAAQVPGRMGI
jgi:hypothetical protein